jgi:hypothetical protein
MGVRHELLTELLTYLIATGEYLIIQLSGIETGIGLHAETADIDLAFAADDLLRQRLADRRRVFESMA